MQSILEIKNLVKKFPGVNAVNGISFSIDQGTCFGLLGPNGAGKTTTIEMIEGIMSPTSGEILYKGKTRGKSFKQEIGIQFQNTQLPESLTIGETLTAFRNLYDRKADLDVIIKTCQLESIWERDNVKISGGQKQRLLLSMALANEPEIVFLDEPTTGLDPQARRHVWEIVRQIKSNNRTVILTTHYMEEAQILCDKIAIIDHGKIIVLGAPLELINKHCKKSLIIIQENIDEKKLIGFKWPYIKKQNEFEIQAEEVNECIEELIKRKISLSKMTVRTMNLEDLFLKLTGKELRN
ncbi:MAG: ABC transporter ATP-binding protein [Desulfobacterales bacterium]|nr:ABC transporter ATP-binding protein [Desulfobacterales bacterium]